MHKVVINSCYGGFGLSDKAKMRLKELGLEFDWECDIPRHHPLLVQVVEELGEKASGTYSKLEVVEIDSNMYRITEYDGFEGVKTPNDREEWVVISD
jgi:hypothetical protein